MKRLRHVPMSRDQPDGGPTILKVQNLWRNLIRHTLED
jgi:hypothetical protein